MYWGFICLAFYLCFLWLWDSDDDDNGGGSSTDYDCYYDYRCYS